MDVISDNDVARDGSILPFPDVPADYAPSVNKLAIKIDGNRIILVYKPQNGVEFIDENFRGDDGSTDIKIKRVFTFRRGDIIDLNAEYKTARSFVLGRICAESPNYFKIEGRVLDINNNLLICKDAQVSIDWFSPINSYRYGVITVFDKIDHLIKEDIIIGGDHERAIPVDEWNAIIARFPNETEIGHYCNSRIQALLESYFDSMPDSKARLVHYIERRTIIKMLDKEGGKPASVYDTAVANLEIEKYKTLAARLVELLCNEEVSEKDWEREILKMILLIYPKYVAVIPQMKISENLTNPGGKAKDRFFDIVLVDADGHVDLVEIKKPSASSIFREVTDHDNAIPSLSLTKAVMQMEKYILYLQKGGYALERKLNEKYSKQLPDGLRIKIVNPKGLMILGRRTQSKAFETDFEVLRRRYANIIDILTYDDLIVTFKRIVDRFKGWNSILK